jgi:SAM-dependent methyltransferase
MRDSAEARRRFFGHKPANLLFLLENRYGWMNRFLAPSMRGLEVGSGSGLSREFVKPGTLLQTDFAESEWLDQKNVDALATPFLDGQFDFIIASHVIHHVPNSVVFFREMERILKPGGIILINEVKNSVLMRTILRMMKHESYDYGVDVFDETAPMKKMTGDVWAANCAVPDLLFDDLEQFRRGFPRFAVVYHEYCECFVLLNSGGVDRATLRIPLPAWVNRHMKNLDRALISLSPGTFAMSRRVVLRKVPADCE